MLSQTVFKFIIRGLTIVVCLAACYLFLTLTSATLDTGLVYGGF
jgi:hypothetical protein